MYLCTSNCIVLKPYDYANVLVYNCFVPWGNNFGVQHQSICKYCIKNVCNYGANKMCVKSWVTSKAWNPPRLNIKKCANPLRNKLTLCLTVFVDSIYTRMYPVKFSVNQRQYF